MALDKSTEFDPSVLSIRLLSLIEKKPDSRHDVHQLRTTIRRLEVQLANPPKKVAKSLKHLRKKAGKVRDIDVHLGLIKTPLAPRRSPNRDAIATAQEKLRDVLKTRRDRRLDSLLDEVSDARPLLESKLPIVAEGVTRGTPSASDVHHQTSQARQRFLQLTRRVPGDPQQLHQLRIDTKKLRYSLEPLETFPEPVEAVAKFKQVQDAIGDWHDWLTLTQLAQRKLPSSAAPLCSALQARTGREYKKARRVAENVRSWIGGGTRMELVHSAPRKINRKAG